MTVAQERELRISIDKRHVPLYILALALTGNFFWRGQFSATGNNIPLILISSLLFILLWGMRGLGVTGALPLRIPRVLWPAALYVLAVLASVILRADFQERTLELALKTIALFLIALVVPNVARSLDSLERSLYILIVGFTLAAVYGFADYILNHRYYLDIWVGRDEKNSSGLYLMVVSIFAFFFVVRSDRLSKAARRWLSLALVICLGAMFLTLSRSAVVSLCGSLFMIFLLYHRKINLRIVLVVLAIAVGVAVLMPSTVRDRLGTTLNFQTQKGTSNSSRLILLRTGLRMAVTHPLLGIGIGHFDEDLGSYITPRERYLLGYATYSSSHNQYVDAVLDGGVVALLALLWLLGQVLWMLHRQIRREPHVPRRYLLMAFAALWWSFAINFLIEHQLHQELVWFMLGMTAALFELVPAESPDSAPAALPAPPERGMLPPAGESA